MEHIPPDRTMTRGQTVILVAIALPMIAAGGVGAWGTYTNIGSVLHRSATALGVVAAGEGATLVLALVHVGLTMLGQSSPLAVRLGLWLLPAVASGTGVVVAQDGKDAVVFAVTPMAMSVSAEGMGLLARRVVIHRTGTDMEAQRRNAETMQRLAYTRALATNHPDPGARKRAELKSWKLAKRVGVGDDNLGAGLVTVQREQMTAGASSALADMLTPAMTVPALPSGTEDGETVTPPGTPGATDEEDASRDRETVTLADLAAVAGVTVPVPGEKLGDEQLNVVLRYLRYSKNPPLSYRQAVTAFRDAGFVGGESRVRKAWGHLMSHEEGDSDHNDQDQEQEEPADR